MNRPNPDVDFVPAAPGWSAYYLELDSDGEPTGQIEQKDIAGFIVWIHEDELARNPDATWPEKSITAAVFDDDGGAHPIRCDDLYEYPNFICVRGPSALPPSVRDGLVTEAIAHFRKLMAA